MCDFPTAELVKVAANACLAMKLSFIKAIAEVCEVAGANVAKLAEAWAMTTESGESSSTPASASGAAIYPRTFARSWPGPTSSARARLWSSCAR